MTSGGGNTRQLEQVHVGSANIGWYEGSAGAERIGQLRTLAAPLRGVRVLHLNATPYGGGVAEILFSEIPLLRDLGPAADWRVITGNAEFFRVTKLIHNGLQGAKHDLAAADREVYRTNSSRIAQLFEGEYDLIVVLDPQPMALLDLHGKAPPNGSGAATSIRHSRTLKSGTACDPTWLSTTRRSLRSTLLSRTTSLSSESKSFRRLSNRRVLRTSNWTPTWHVGYSSGLAST